MDEDYDFTFEDSGIDGLLEQLEEFEGQVEGIELPSFDYNLNSPLLRDDVDDFVMLLRGLQASPRIKDKWNVKESLAWLRTIGIGTEYVSGSMLFHEWVFRDIVSKENREGDLREQFAWIEDFLSGPCEVLNSFMSVTISSDSQIQLELIKKTGILNDGCMSRTRSEIRWFNLFHVIVNLLNSADASERETLSTTFKLYDAKIVEKSGSNSFLCQLVTQSLGLVYVTVGFVVIRKFSRVLNRNMCLMIKDLLGARICSKLSLYKQHSIKDYPTMIRKLDALYESGDKLMIATDNWGYDVIKLLEGSCNLRFMELANLYRPLIPLDSAFSNHIRTSISSFEADHRVDCQDFFTKIFTETDPEMIAIYYGSFRHWGHPFIDYLEGLQLLYDQVTRESEVDEGYANKLASDLAFKVLSFEFHKQKRWFVDPTYLPSSHPLKEHFLNQTWPTAKQILDFGDNWHELPLSKCYEIPIGLDPALLYADKSHSMTRSSVMDHILSYPNTPIPSKKVLHSALFEPEVFIPEFLLSINDNGLEKDDLIIGLKGKEREVKRVGRFFSLMSWKLRLYFVITEYLIKKYYVPLFSGLTMADDYNSVVRKLLDRSLGQGEPNYKRITFANHFDYSKWNNTQRGKANNPVFRVMGLFLGLPRLFERTHQFFEESLIYYNDRGDLMDVVSGQIVNKPGYRVCWEGQLGGLEGLRQKGWSVVSLLVIERESKIRNTRVKVLAQGDNQVICTYYEIPSSYSSSVLKEEIPHIVANNKRIVESINAGTTKLALVINMDETMISADYLNYGKVVIFRGVMLPLTTKRWSRVTCVTNDQIPSLGNIMSAVTANSLTVAQQSPSVIPVVVNFMFFSAFCLWYINQHHPILGTPTRLYNLIPRDSSIWYSSSINLVFLDPSLGGLCGTSINRFLLRQFPDPITESLSFWKTVYEGAADEKLRKLCVQNGNPKVVRPTEASLIKLLENPMGLNLPKGLNSVTVLKDAVREQLIRSVETITNGTFRESIRYLRDEESALLGFLTTVKPLFPRFISEFKSSTFFGITESMVGLFQNSRTIRMIFKRRFARTVNGLMHKYEVENFDRLLYKYPHMGGTIWRCSSEHADMLREMSWGEPVVGTTIPHPSELLGRVTRSPSNCNECRNPPYPGLYVSVIYPFGLNVSHYIKGPLSPYLGSRTSESTSLFQPWEKIVDTPLLQKSVKLRNAIQWFVNQGSNLCQSILNNLTALTNISWEEDLISFKRTGSAIHRFRCSRQSSGVYASVNPNLLSYVFVTSDTLHSLNQANHDFMYQSLLLYSQMISVEQNISRNVVSSHHFHIKCGSCIREISEVILDTPIVYQPKNVAHLVEAMSAQPIKLASKLDQIKLPIGNWGTLSSDKQSFYVGVIQSLIYCLSVANNEKRTDEQGLFPESITRFVQKSSYLIGILRGLILGGGYLGMYHKELYDPKRPIRVIHGSVEFLMDKLLSSSHFLPSMQRWDITAIASSVPHRIPPSYPSTKGELGSILKSYFHHHLDSRTLLKEPFKQWSRKLWIFADFRTTKWIGLILCALYTEGLFYVSVLSTDQLNKVREIKDLICYFLQTDRESHCSIPLSSVMIKKISHLTSHTYGCPYEVRFAVKQVLSGEEENQCSNSVVPQGWTEEITCSGKCISLYFGTQPYFYRSTEGSSYKIDPLISGLRWAQLATGAHYKIRTILRFISAEIRDVVCVGDGSGGMSAAILRRCNNSKLIFNSLMEPNGQSFMGVTPSPPAAIYAMDERIRSRCVNLFSCWSEPSDLRASACWSYLCEIKERNEMDVNLLVMDMEVTSIPDILTIIDHLTTYMYRLVTYDGTVVIKLYSSLLINDQYLNLVNNLGALFYKVQAVFCDISSSFTSEFYLVLTQFLSEPTNPSFLLDSSLNDIFNHSFINHSVAKEFKRALSLKAVDMFMGVPQCFIPPLEEEFFSLLVGIGLETGVAKAFSRGLEDEVNDCNILTYIISTLILVSESLINTTYSYSAYKNYPSLEILQRHYAMFIGCWSSVAWISEDLGLYKLIHWWVENKLYYGFNQYKTVTGYRVRWNWNKGRVGKTLHKPSKLSISSQFIRLFSRMSRTTKEDPRDEGYLITGVEFIRDHYNNNVSLRHIMSNTGLISWKSLRNSHEENPQCQENQIPSHTLMDVGLLRNLGDVNSGIERSWIN
ncbi:MAG: RNA-dependent RNA polymerase [Wufeng shrew rhabdovirus 1]|nr:MAG: RNA-dependent RNA polymerase [Wufeng shrew rhabdovirus 1]